MAYYRNVQHLVGFDLVKTDGTADTTTVPTTRVSKEGGAYAASTNAAARTGTTNSFTLLLTPAENDAALVQLEVAGAGCIPRTYTFYPEADWTATRAGYLDVLNGIVAAIWATAGRTLSTAPPTAAEVATAVWAAGARTLTSFGTLVADVAAAVWAAGARTLTSFGFSVAVADKTGFALSAAEHAAIATDTQTGLTNQGLTAARSVYLDKLNITGNVASSSEVTAIQNNTRAVRVVPEVMERPDAGTQAYQVHLYLYDTAGAMEAPDAAPTVAVTNQAGTSRADHLDSTTLALVSAGHYQAVYTVQAADALEQLLWEFSVVEGGATRVWGNTTLLVDTTAVDFTADDRTKLVELNTRLTALRAGYLDNLSGGAVALESTLTALKGAGWTNESLKGLSDAIATRLASASYVEPDNAGIATAAAQATTAATQATGANTKAGAIQTVLTGITSLGAWLRALARKSAPDATALVELNTGGGTYDATTDALQAQADAAAASAPTAAEIAVAVDGTLTTNHGAGSWQTGSADAGTGANTVTLTVTDEGGTPLEGAKVRLTLGQQRPMALTNAQGVATLYVDNGTYAVAVTLEGYQLAAADPLVVAGDAAATYALSAIVIAPDADPAKVVAWLVTRGPDGTSEGGIKVTFRLVTPPAGAGSSYQDRRLTVTSDAVTHRAQASLLRGGEYDLVVGAGSPLRFTATDTDTMALGPLLGA